MSVQYHISPSGHNLRCKICGNYYLFGNIRVCQVCGIILCKKHFHNGFCETHYQGLTKKDKQKVQELLQEIAKVNRIFWGFALGLVITVACAFLWGFLAKPFEPEDFPVAFQIIGIVLGIAMACSALAFRIQKDANWGEITRLAKRYEKAQEIKSTFPRKSEPIPQNLKCPNCSNYNLSGAKFCSTCGKEFVTQQV